MRVHDLLDHWAARHPDEVYLSDGERELTWREVREWSCRIGHWLASRLEPGERFALLDRNSLEMIAIYFGASRAGVVPVPLNFRLAPAEWEFIVTDAGCALAVVHGDYEDALAAVAPDRMAVVTIDGDGTRPDFATEVAGHPGTDLDRDVSPDAVFHQMYTSGTTGQPKGALVSQLAVCLNAIQFHAGLEAVRVSSLCTMPLFHAGAEVSVFAFTVGGCSIRVLRDFDPATTLRILAEDRIRTTGLAPAMIQAMIAHPLAKELSFDDLDLIVYGSAPIAGEVLALAMELFECDFAQAYGMTELSAVATMLSRSDHVVALRHHRELLTSAGRPVLGTQVRIVDEDDQELPWGSTGEVVVRGPQLMSGYWQQEEATAAALRGGWMHTGDVGHLDRDGYLFVSDRVKDMIISGGENIYPRQIEEVLFELDGVADAAVVGVPSSQWGERPLAVVVRAPGSDLTESAVIDFCRERLASYKCPSAVAFVDALPRNTVGKVLKRELRAPYWADLERSVN
ncbi:long-chain-fatty-acid--CoA ligase [Nocardioides sp. CN2-186]|uniref:long-chain-fatty-acid--CoA ligase n=1 Tax=Nocardioides tweenelious TaxID=3156607 RepID=UPI0032B48EDE